MKCLSCSSSIGMNSLRWKILTVANSNKSSPPTQLDCVISKRAIKKCQANFVLKSPIMRLRTPKNYVTKTNPTLKLSLNCAVKLVRWRPLTARE